MSDTMKEIPTKWQWIRDYCISRGFIDAAQAANNIDKFLQEVYPDISQTTIVWDKDYKRGLIRDMKIRNIIESRIYCLGCEVTGEYSCDSCKFKRAGGHIMFHRFEDLYYKYSSLGFKL